jgi:hypothetical protein
LKFLFWDDIRRVLHFRSFRRKGKMDNWTFGTTMVIVGMGGTVLSLWILSLLMSLLKNTFPYKKEEEEKK